MFAYICTLLFNIVRNALGLERVIPDSTVREYGFQIAEHTRLKKQVNLQDSQRDAEMLHDGLAWDAMNKGEETAETKDSHLELLPACRLGDNYKGSVAVELGDELLKFFDFRMFFEERSYTLAPQLQTAVSYRVRDLEAPHFYLRSLVNQSAVPPELLSCYEKVDSMTALGYNMAVESTMPSRVVTFMDSAVVFNELLPYLKDRQMTIEWTGDRLIAYRLNCTVLPNEMKQFGQEAIELGQILHRASAAYTDQVNSAIDGKNRMHGVC